MDRKVLGLETVASVSLEDGWIAIGTLMTNINKFSTQYFKSKLCQISAKSAKDDLSFQLIKATVTILPETTLLGKRV